MSGPDGCDWGTRTEAGQKVPQAKPEQATPSGCSRAERRQLDVGALTVVTAGGRRRAAEARVDQEAAAGKEPGLKVDIIARRRRSCDLSWTPVCSTSLPTGSISTVPFFATRYHL